MPMLGLREEWEEPVESGRKTRTTRWNARHYFKMAGFKAGEIDEILRSAEQAPVKERARNLSRLHVYIGTRGRWKRKLGESPEHYAIEAWKGEHFTDEMAQEDGFGTAREMKQWMLGAHENVTMADIDANIWASIPLDIRRYTTLDVYG